MVLFLNFKKYCVSVFRNQCSVKRAAAEIRRPACPLKNIRLLSELTLHHFSCTFLQTILKLSKLFIYSSSALNAMSNVLIYLKIQMCSYRYD